MLLSGRREADILRGGGRDAADEEGGERAGDGGDEDIYPEGEVAEGTEEGCAADWHARVLTGGVIWDYIVRSYGYFCVSPVGYLGLYVVGGYKGMDIHMQFLGSRRRDVSPIQARFYWDS